MMLCSLFCSRYLKEHFIVGLRAMNIKFPVLLLVDGCDSHVSFEISGNSLLDCDTGIGL